MQFVAVSRSQVATIDTLQPVHDLDRFLGKWRFALETVQDDALEQIAQGQFAILRQPLEDLQKRFLNTDARLGPIHKAFFLVVSRVGL